MCSFISEYLHTGIRTQPVLGHAIQSGHLLIIQDMLVCASQCAYYIIDLRSLMSAGVAGHRTLAESPHGVGCLHPNHTGAFTEVPRVAHYKDKEKIQSCSNGVNSNNGMYCNVFTRFEVIVRNARELEAGQLRTCVHSSIFHHLWGGGGE